MATRREGVCVCVWQVPSWSQCCAGGMHPHPRNKSKLPCSTLEMAHRQEMAHRGLEGCSPRWVQ